METGRRDPKAPRFLELTITDSEGKLWSKTIANEKTFSTGSVGYFGSDKITNPESGERYQCGFNIALIGSKPEKN
ncbi:hypothetical protein FACS1894190_09640 [Spirochaetia bacterium]|nr:hypothetical protein FACS1894190_09640 [Spirochaetia bacterium]GHV22199.1 hypothetical protein FACS189494_08700 [Spirochaetia bacterium]